MAEGLESEYQKYELSDEEKFAYSLKQSREVVHLWQTLSDSNADVTEIRYNGYKLYLGRDRFGEYHRICVPVSLEWLNAKDNNGLYIDEKNNRVYVIKSTGVMKILDKSECEIESTKRKEAYEKALPKILKYCKTKTNSTFNLELIGSAQVGTATETSDIDVLTNIKIDRDDLLQFCGKLESEFGYPFDLIYDKSNLNSLMNRARHLGI